jgi:hypothetical protein
MQLNIPATATFDARRMRDEGLCPDVYGGSLYRVESSRYGEGTRSSSSRPETMVLVMGP